MPNKDVFMFAFPMESDTGYHPYCLRFQGATYEHIEVDQKSFGDRSKDHRLEPTLPTLDEYDRNKRDGRI